MANGRMFRMAYLIDGEAVGHICKTWMTQEQADVENVKCAPWFIWIAE